MLFFKFLGNKLTNLCRIGIFILRTFFECTICANVAQSVEQLIRNQQVAGSIPAVSSSKNGKVASLWKQGKACSDLLKK